MPTTFPGVFAGKTAFCSSQPNGPNYYLTSCRVSDGNHGWIYWPGLNASAITTVEKFLLYLFPDNYYRIQSGDLRWLTLDGSDSFLQYGDDPLQAAAFVIGGTPFGSSWQLHINNGNQQIYYNIQSNLNSPNLLSLNQIEGALSIFTPTFITPSLETIRQQKQAKNADFTHAILLGQDLSQGIDFTEANFMGSQLGGVNFTSAILDKANLSQTDLRELNWGQPTSANSIDLSGSNAAGCQFGNSGTGTNQLNCQNANLSTANLTEANLANLNLQGAQLGNAILNNAVLDYATLTSANLNNVVAIKASFAHAVFTDASAQMGIFIQSIFDNATLTRVRMGASSYLFLINSNFANELNTSKYPQSDLIAAFQQNGITLNPNAAIEIVTTGERWQLDDPLGPYKLILIDSGIQVYNDNPSLVPAVLQGASFMGTNASTASLSGADLRGTQWFAAPVTLDHADLEDAAFSGALCISVDFTQANLSGVDFSNSIFVQAKFTGCVAGPGGNRRAVSFENAHLEGTDFSKSTFNGAVLTNAVVALNAGVPLLFLPLADQQYLTTSGIATIKQAFTDAGFDLGSTPTVANASTFSLDNSQSDSPYKLYTVKSTNAGFQVFGGGLYLFSLPTSAAPLLRQKQASDALVSMFASRSQNHCLLASNAPITQQVAWAITPSDDAAFLKSYRFPNLSIQLEANRLVVYGVALVLVDGLANYSDGIAFNATQNLGNALSANAVGPAGVPFAWIAQNLIDNEAFYVALN